MKYNELFTDGLKLFDGIFKERYPDIYAAIFDGKDPDTFALLKYGEHELLPNMTTGNVKGYIGAILDMCADTFKSQWDTFNKEYDFLKPVLSATETDKTVTVSEMNTNGTVKSDKTFADNDFLADSKEDKTNDRDKTEKETSTVSHTGITGNVSESVLNEYRLRSMNVREQIINDLVSYITLSVYN